MQDGVIIVLPLNTRRPSRDLLARVGRSCLQVYLGRDYHDCLIVVLYSGTQPTGDDQEGGTTCIALDTTVEMEGSSAPCLANFCVRRTGVIPQS